MPRCTSLICACLIALILAATARADTINVTKAPPKIERKTFDPANLPKPAPPLHEHEIAVCEYLYRIEVDLKFTPLTVAPAPGGGVRASVRVDSAAIRLSMPITVWLPKGVDDQVKAHEDGHKAIAEFFYKDADKAAREAAKGVVGREVEADGKDKNAAMRAALGKAAEEISQKYMASVKDPCAQAQAKFDEITDHSNNRELKSDAAAAQVLEKWKNEAKK